MELPTRSSSATGIPSRAAIIDWNYIDMREERMHGNYTLCALLSAEPGEEAERLIETYKLDCRL